MAIQFAFDTIVATGSVDAICAVGAALGQHKNPNAVSVIWTQAFKVNGVVAQPDLKKGQAQLPTGKKILMIDLAVNNAVEKDEDGNEIEVGKQMTIDFVARLLEAGNTIWGICDEHDHKAWQQVLEANGLSVGDLAIQPVSQAESEIKSSSALLLSYLGSKADDFTRSLLEAGDLADQARFEGVAEMVNRAIKGNLGDNSRRDYLARHLVAGNAEADEKISSWIAGYEAMLATHEEIFEAAEYHLNNQLIVVDSDGKKIDVSTFSRQLAKKARVACVIASRYDKSIGAKVPGATFSSSDRSLDLLKAIQEAGVPVGGFGGKATVAPSDMEAAIEAIRKLLAS